MVEIERARLEVSQKLDPAVRTQLGQYMTPYPIAEFMARLLGPLRGPIHALDPGAGMGALSIALAQRTRKTIFIDAWEIDPGLQIHLREHLRSFARNAVINIIDEDFIEGGSIAASVAGGRRYTHAILNPPYKKINSDSRHRRMLRMAGIETVNLYSAFVALSIRLLEKRGRLVAIIPRSFCNGPYYKPFRRLVLDQCSIEQIHVFHARNKAFADDEVLQENVIISLSRLTQQGGVKISRSTDATFSDYEEDVFPFAEIVRGDDPEAFIHIPESNPISSIAQTGVLLRDTGLDVCTGPVVDFRLREWWLFEPAPGSVPLIYPHDLVDSPVAPSQRKKKPIALMRSSEVDRWLMPTGYYVAVKRFSSKEERRRVVAYVVRPQTINGPFIGFENHLNIFHLNRSGIDAELAHGLCAYLNSTLFDRLFRSFSGHTQVNATDLRNLRYPSLQRLRVLGRKLGERELEQQQLDHMVERLADAG